MKDQSFRKKTLLRIKGETTILLKQDRLNNTSQNLKAQ